jgi:hypothetical protein
MTTNRINPYLIISLLVVVMLAACSSPAPVQYHIEVTGDVNRVFEGGEIFLEDTPSGKQIWIQKKGRGEEMQVVQVSLLKTVQEGEYIIYPNTPVIAGYLEDIDGVSEVYDVNPMGKITFQREGDTLRGTIDFTAQALWGDGSVHVVGEFWDIPYQETRPTNKTGDTISSGMTEEKASAADTPSTNVSKFVTGAFTCAFGFFLIANFVIQFYVGRRVYASSGMTWLRSLNGTRTFLRGWQDESLKPVMVAWSVLIGVLGIALCLVVFLSST